MKKNSYEFSEKMMRLCLELAEKGKYFVKSNPMVGAILASKDGEILSQGYHKAFGEKHAEVLAYHRDWILQNIFLFLLTLSRVASFFPKTHKNFFSQFISFLLLVVLIFAVILFSFLLNDLQEKYHSL